MLKPWRTRYIHIDCSDSCRVQTSSRVCVSTRVCMPDVPTQYKQQQWMRLVVKKKSSERMCDVINALE